jgi:acyl-CoA synthetase (AMP-forming)/AMP-acid ligase II
VSAGWNFGRLWRTAAEVRPDATALVHGRTRVTWREWDARAGALAAGLRAAGLRAGMKVAVALYNSNEYLESYFACFRAGLVPVNTNYRYQVDELAYLWSNADCEAVVFHGALTERAGAARPRLPQVRCWIWLDDGSGEKPGWATSYEELLGFPPEADEGRTGDDIFLLYTGGTTGLPKGVIWTQDNFFAALHRRPWSPREEARLADSMARPERPVVLPGAPLMHGTGLGIAWSVLDVGGTAITLPDRRFDPRRYLHAVAEHRVTTAGIVGDAFAIPLVQAYRDDPAVDLSSVRNVVSSGAMWSRRAKEQILEIVPDAELIDILGSSEAQGVGRSVTKAGVAIQTAHFRLSDVVVVIADDGTLVAPGSGRAGRVAMLGPAASGYYKDEALTAATFFEHDGKRLAVTGDYVTVDSDGTVRFLGRGNMCINSGGEKVYPEEVEEVLKGLGGVRDAAVVGVPDPRFGEVVCAIVDRRDPALEPGDIIDGAKRRLAAYKAPRLVLWGDVARTPNMKVDYPRLKEWALRESRELQLGGQQ